MASCAYMIDIMVGDLCLTNPPAILHRTKNPLCPIVAVQVLDGPLLYIPFLTPESVQSHLHDVNKGHDFLPLEIEESYLNGGKFVFRKGRSCLFTTRCNSVTGKEEGKSKNKDGFCDVGQNVNILVLNGLTFPPAVFGRCKATIPVSGTENGEPKRSLIGKVILTDHTKNSIASLQVSVSLRSLGEDIALHAKHFDNSNSEEIQSIPGTITINKVNDEITSPHNNLRKMRLDKTISLLQEKGNSKPMPIQYAHNAVMEQSYTINQHFVNAGLGSSNYVSQSIPESSELIAMKIAEFERNSPSKLLGGLNTTVFSPDLERKVPQPSPFIFTGKDAEAERLWNHQMKEVGGYTFDIEETFPSTGRDESVSKEAYQTVKIKKKQQNYKEDQIKKTKPTKERSKRGTFKDSTEAIHSPTKGKVKHIKGIKRPTGWLRSTPVAPYRMHTEPPQPKLTRTSLLRRAKLDPELAKQLRAEVDFQVKQKLKVLDEAFREEMSNLRQKKLMRSARLTKMAVSSQTEDERAEDDLLIESKPSSGLEDFAQQTDLFHQKSHQFTQMGESFTRDVDESASDKKTGSPLSSKTTTKRRAGVRRGETYDIDMNDRMGATFVLNEIKDMQENLDTSVDKKSKKTIKSPKDISSQNNLKASPLVNKPASDHSQSITESEPKQRRRGSNSTNRTREKKMKPPESTYVVSPKAVTNVRRYSSESVEDDASVEELLVSSSSTKGNSESSEDMKYDSRRISSAQTVSDYENSNNEASEVSEASNLSVEVYQEILKGKKADLLMSNGSKSSRVQEAMSDSSPVEEVLTAEDDSPGDVSPKVNKRSNIIQQFARGKINSRTYSIKEGQGLDGTYNIPVIHGSSSSENGTLVRAGNRETRTLAQSSPRYSPKEVGYRERDNIRLQNAKTTPSPKMQSTKTTPSPRIQSIKTTPSPRLLSTKTTLSPRINKYQKKKNEEEEEEGTVSDISARIAALLLPKKVEVASLHTDSISSYMPSDVDGTLSSLSDME